MTMASGGRPTAGRVRVAASVLLAVAGGLLALGAVADLGLKTLSFGGSDTASTDVTAGQAGGHLLLVAAGVFVPIAAARALLGRVPSGALATAVAAGLLLGLAVLGLSI